MLPSLRKLACLSPSRPRSSAIFCSYGQTGSGKSYTMGTSGSDTDYTVDSSSTGIIPRAVKDMFAQLEQEERLAGSSMQWECKVSFLELYNEVRDMITILKVIADPPSRISSTCYPLPRIIHPRLSQSAKTRVKSSGRGCERYQSHRFSKSCSYSTTEVLGGKSEKPG
jgi:hypothetical protein